MASWPPSPAVEDEVTALAREHTPDIEAQPKKDEHSVPSKGEVDQYPIIVDSDSSTETLVKDQKCQPEPQRVNSQNQSARQPVSQSFQADTGLPTPPTSDSETRSRFADKESGRNRSRAPGQHRSKSTGRPNEFKRRPSIPRIQTATNDSTLFKTSKRRSISPYAYTRESGTFRIDEARRRNAGVVLSDTEAGKQSKNTSSEEIHRRCQAQSDGEAPVKASRDILFTIPQSHGHREQELNIPGTFPQHDTTTTRRGIQADSTAVQADQHVRRSQYQGSDKAEHSSKHSIGASESDVKTSSRLHHSPAPPADDSDKDDRYMRTRRPGIGDDHVARRRMSYKTAKPRLEDTSIGSQSSVRNTRVSDDCPDRTRSHRPYEAVSSSTKVEDSRRQSGEDYFSRSWQYPAPRISKDESILRVQPVSPPRTPRGEPNRRGEYFESITSSPARSPSHSRAPSLEDVTIRDNKTHASLLSQALSAAAVKASRTGGLARSTANAFETTLACSASPTKSQSRSRASSPQRDRTQRGDPYTYMDQAMAKVMYPAVPPPRRPSTRDGLPNITILPSPIVAPQRNASWTSYEPRYEPQQLSKSPYDTAQLSAALPNTTRPATLSRSQSASNAANSSATATEVTFKPCLREEPTQGKRDWVTLNGLSNINICPSCVQTIQSTRLQPLLQRCAEKPFDRWTSCSFGKSWIQIAFQRLLKQSKPDLSVLQEIIELPKATYPCLGSKTDVRGWWTLRDPETNRTVADFFACSACIRSVHILFPDLPDQFSSPGPLHSEQVCSFHSEGSNFDAMARILDEIDRKCRGRQKSSARYMQPFVDHLRRSTRRSKCARDAFVTNRAWHFMNDLPEFTICDSCYEEAVLPHREKSSIARDVSMLSRPITLASIRSPNQNLQGTKIKGGTPVSCQLYSDRTRSLFADVLNGRISYEGFKGKVKERQEAQCRLTEMNMMLEDDQKRFGWSRQEELDRNRAYWRALE